MKMNSKIDMEKITFRNETPADYKAVENLTREAFWNVYKPGCDEHFMLHSFRTRSDFVPELDILMEENSVLIGHVMFVKAEIRLNNGGNLPIMTFGPISIVPDFKCKGYGTVLIRHAMQKAKKINCGALAITGNIGFYGKSGFVVAKTKDVFYHADPDADYFLIKELISGFFRPSERSRRRNIQGAGRILHRLKKSRRIRQEVSAERKAQTSRTDFRVRLWFSASLTTEFLQDTLHLL